MYTWKQYLSLTGRVDYAIEDHINHICRTHYRRIFQLKQTRKCTTCSTQQSSDWRLVCNIANSPEKVCESFSLELGFVHFFDWICHQCCSCYANDEQLEMHLNSTIQSQDQLMAERSSLLLRALDTLKREGIVFTKEIGGEFKLILNNLDVDPNMHSRLCNTFSKYLNNLINNRFKTYASPDGNDSLGKIIYDETKFTLHSIIYIFTLKKSEWERKKTHISFKDLQRLIKNQAALFPTSKGFDYTQTITDTMNIDRYFDPQLTEIVLTITKSTNATKEKCSALYNDLRTSRIRMVIALLCFTMNPQCCFIQTLMGLMCYAYGLRDKGFELLNAVGCTCSIDNVRAHGSYWASRHKPILQLNTKQFWRVTIDNLNFYIKFAKNFSETSTGAKKMLNLLTGQVTHQVPVSNHPKFTPLRLVEIVHKSIANFIHSSISPKQRSMVQVKDFSNIYGTNETFYFEMFLRSCYTCVVNRLSLQPTAHSKSFIETLPGYMPHWTPPKKDNVVYATIDEALSGSIVDIESYLSKLKKELHIGEEGYPEQVALAGDQQTFLLS